MKVPTTKPIISLVFASFTQIGELSGKDNKNKHMICFWFYTWQNLGGTSPSRPYEFMREKKVGCKGGGKSKNLGDYN